jgi:5-methylcytosine-specific restriction endonuclease McrA
MNASAPPKVRMLRSHIAAQPRRLASMPVVERGEKHGTLGFYGSAAWKALRNAVIRERGRNCQQCPRSGCRVYCDHRIELSDGGAPLDPANVVVLCASCHTRKTAAARMAREKRMGSR